MRSVSLALFLIPAVSGAAVNAGDPSKTPDYLINVLQGAEWGWERTESIVSCENNPHIISFNAKQTEAVFKFRKPIDGADGKRSDRAVYKILTRRDHVITMQIVGERRLDPQGQPVVWDLILINERTYTWRRLDWPASSHTPYIHKCH